ncbi:MAG: hypothetical protein LBE34_09995 [Flavobacteriaceae bacterium]|jgi:hypothetical protein|nr:hypothetical protein [Flavobacteriaceae bacterium]
MRNYIVIFFVLLATFGYSQEEGVSEDNVPFVNQVIELFKAKDKEGIAAKIYYPLKREYPIPDVKNKEEFVQRFNEIFDTAFAEEIANSSMADWSTVGWRGTMFKEGDLWINDEGYIYIVNRQSKAETKGRKGFVKEDKKSVNKSLKKFKQAIAIAEVDPFLIRIDEMENEQYRLVFWNKGQSMKEKPLRIVEGGKMTIEGTMRIRTLFFEEGDKAIEIALDYVEASEPNEILYSEGIKGKKLKYTVGYIKQ